MKKSSLGKLAMTVIAFQLPAGAITSEQADQAFRAFNKTYWNATGKYFYKKDDKTGVLDFWLSAHAWETVMDAYARTGDPTYKQQIKDVYDGFIARHTADWTQNDYNDDIAWWILACTHAYGLTGEKRYLTQAQSQFDWVYRTQRDTVKGGIWWRNDVHAERNSCVVQPMILSAAHLAKHMGDNTYLVKAESLYAWQKRTLLAPSGGQVYDNIKDNGSISTYTSTYNQGTFIGSAVALGRMADARNVADWTRTNMCTQAGVLKESGQGDVGGFKLILARYVMGLSKLPGNEAYRQWMEANANAVWGNRRSDGIMGYDWTKAAPGSGIECQCAAGGVSLLNLLATSNVAIRPIASPSRNAENAGVRLRSAGSGNASLWFFAVPGDGSAASGGAAAAKLHLGADGRLSTSAR